ncbi:MAG: PEP/pyruvate-binding domain-containing protein [Candidatus Micrarchaeales archaeon]
MPNGIAIPSSYPNEVLEGINSIADAKTTLENAKMGEISEEIRKHVKGDKLIMRSSSVFEDTPDHQAYGLYKSEICAPDTLEKSLRNCFSAPFSNSVVNFKNDRGLPLIEGIPLLVQEYVVGEISGIIQTVNMHSRRQTEMLIEIVEGSCSLVTSGEGLPSCYTVNKADKEIKVLSERFAVKNKVIEQIANAAQKLSSELKTEVDVEFTIEGEKLIILQARPIAMPSLFKSEQK